MDVIQRLIQHNFTKARGEKHITGIVLHTEDSPKKEGSKDRSLYQYFNTTHREVSAHYYVTFSGKIEQYVSDEDTAWHAGVWGINQQTIGIEHQDNGYADTGEKYTNEQYEASAQLVASLCKKYGIPIEYASDPASGVGVILHRDVCQTGCPHALDWKRIIARAREIAALSIAQRLIKRNFTEGRAGQNISGIVLHTEGAEKIEGTEDRSLYRYFSSNTKGTSAHYYITFSGNVEQYVLDKDKAHHTSSQEINRRTIGIEHQDNGFWSGGERYTDAQYEASAQLVARLCKKHGILIEHSSDPQSGVAIILHKEVTETGCPHALDWERIIARAKEIAAIDAGTSDS